MAGYTSGNTTLLDTITRTYYNNSNDIICTQHISVQVKPVSVVDGAGRNLSTSAGLSTQRFKRTAVIKLVTDQSHSSSGSGQSRTISRVTTTGKFTSHNVDGNGDISYVTYAGTANVNDLVIPVNTLDGVWQEGDTP